MHFRNNLDKQIEAQMKPFSQLGSKLPGYAMSCQVRSHIVLAENLAGDYFTAVQQILSEIKYVRERPDFEVWKSGSKCTFLRNNRILR